MTGKATPPRLNPRTDRMRADSVRPGHVLMESDEHPAVVVRVAYPSGGVTFWCRFTWQATHEPAWPHGPFHPAAPIDISKER